MSTEQPPPVSRRKLGVFGVVIGIVLVLVVITGIRAREDQGTKLKEWTDDQAIPTVAVQLPTGRAANPTIDLPGRLEAYSRAPIFAMCFSTWYLLSKCGTPVCRSAEPTEVKTR